MKVIGLTGVPSSGKETVKNYIFEMCAERGLSVQRFSFSDEIKIEADARRLPDSERDRDGLTRLVGRMRAEEGAGVLAARIIRRIAAHPADVNVVEALRHPAEAVLLRETYGDDFVLGAIVADLRVIAERLVARNRPDESRTAGRSVEEAIRLLENELRGQTTGNINVRECIELADVTIRNDGTFDELREFVQSAFSQVLDEAGEKM